MANVLGDLICVQDQSFTSYSKDPLKGETELWWSLWVRSRYHVSRCSNHSEGLHSVLNRKCFYCFASNLSIVTKLLTKRYTHQINDHGRSIKRKYFYLQSLSNKFKENMNSINEERCTCGWNDYYSSIYGVRFPCIHEVSKFHECPIPPEIFLEPYDLRNKVLYQVSETINNFKNKEKMDKAPPPLDYSIYENYHNVVSKLGPNSTLAKAEMWKTVKEIKLMFKIDQKTCIDIVIDEFIELGLNIEENVNTYNLALFRVSCWNSAKNYKSNLAKNESQEVIE